MFFNMHLPTKIIFRKEKEALDILKQERENFNLSKVAFFISNSSKKYGYFEKILKTLNPKKYLILDNLPVEPTEKDLESIFQKLKEENISLIVAIGGGSVLDIAKAVGILLKNPLKDIKKAFIYIDKFKNKALDMIAVPTTAGSGSEVTPYSVFKVDALKSKSAIVSRKGFYKLALVIPEYTYTMPSKVTLYSAIDAFSHLIESYLSLRSFEVSEFFSISGIKIFFENISKTLNPTNTSARDNMVKASLYGGISITLAGAGLMHILGHIIGYYKNLPHGHTLALVMPEVIRFYGTSVYNKLRIFEDFLGKRNLNPLEFVNYFADFLKELFYEDLKVEKIKFSEKDIKLFINSLREKEKLFNKLPKIPKEKDITKIFENV